MRTKLILIIASLPTLFSCSSRKEMCYTCDENQRVKVAEFVSNNISPSNNMSDEEMEDVISELRTTGIMLFCNKEVVYVGVGGIDYDKTHIDSTKSYFHGYPFD